MRTTLGQLISELFDVYERRYRDPHLAALAAQVTVNELLSAREGRTRADARRRRGIAPRLPQRRAPDAQRRAG